LKVLSGFLDSILLGVVLCQVGTFFKSGRSQEGLGRCVFFKRLLTLPVIEDAELDIIDGWWWFSLSCRY
jgi:hypothetical protein